jgi:hypothetical protein
VPYCPGARCWLTKNAGRLPALRRAKKENGRQRLAAGRLRVMNVEVQLPATATMEATASMEATGCAMSCWCATRESAARCNSAPNGRASCEAGASRETWTARKSRAACEAWTAVEARSAIPTPRMPAVEPRARADEHATDEPIRPVVAVGRAGVRIIIVVAVSANRRACNHGRADAYANYYALSAGVRSCNCENSEYCDYSECLRYRCDFHFGPLSGIHLSLSCLADFAVGRAIAVPN